MARFTIVRHPALLDIYIRKGEWSDPVFSVVHNRPAWERVELDSLEAALLGCKLFRYVSTDQIRATAKIN